MARYNVHTHKIGSSSRRLRPRFPLDLPSEGTMRLGVPKEIKVHEYRVGLTPDAVCELTGRGHHVLVGAGAGVGVDYSDADYVAAGARIAASPEALFEAVDMV